MSRPMLLTTAVRVTASSYTCLRRLRIRSCGPGGGGGRAAEPPGGMALKKIGRFGRFGRFRLFSGNFDFFMRLQAFSNVFACFWSVLGYFGLWI